MEGVYNILAFEMIGDDSSCLQALSAAKKIAKMFVFDVDGTIKSSAEPEYEPISLVEAVLVKNKGVALVTASGASALGKLAEPLEKLIKAKAFKAPVFLGIANGMALYRLNPNSRQEIHRFLILIPQVIQILKVWQKVMQEQGFKQVDLVAKGLTTFQEFLARDWQGLIPKEFLEKIKKYDGQCFAEELKVTLVMPKEEAFPQKQFIALMQKKLDRELGLNHYIIDRGDTTFAHVTKKPGMTPKLFALKRIIKELKLKKEQVVAFGDMPEDNDRGLLIDSHLPYTFTNQYFNKLKIGKPPFFLPGATRSPVASVYHAVDFLLTQ